MYRKNLQKNKRKPHPQAAYRSRVHGSLHLHLPDGSELDASATGLRLRQSDLHGTLTPLPGLPEIRLARNVARMVVVLLGGKKYNSLQDTFPLHCLSQLSFFGLSFAYDTPKIWNDLPDDVRLATSFHSFRKKLETYLFAKAYQN